MSQLRELIVKWRKEYEVAQWGVWGVAKVPLQDKKDCADELEALVNAMERPSNHDQVQRAVTDEG